MEVSVNSIAAVAKGQLHRVPGYAAAVGLLRHARRRKASARYCYSVWLRHLLAAHQNGLAPKFDVVMEVGPGDSIGAGLAALLSGAGRYVVVDWVRYTNVAENADVLDELADLFARRAPIPDDDEFPDVYPKLPSYGFPDGLLATPSDAKVRRVRQALAQSDSADSADSGESCICYFAPYDQKQVVVPGGADLLFSQAVMEHVDDVEALYRATHGWLKPGGVASHVIDYRSHGTSSRWNGHWTYSDAAWRFVRGGRPFLLNRLPHTAHRERLAASGFDVVADARTKAATEVARDELAPRFRAMSEDDLTTIGALLQAVRR